VFEEKEQIALVQEDLS